MTKQVRSKGGRLIISGAMTIYHASALREQLCAGVTKKRTRHIDLSEVTELDSAGVQLLLAIKAWARSHGREISFGEHSAAVSEVLELLQISFNDVPAELHS
jgi:anti-anti-sigma regulatory factor